MILLLGALILKLLRSLLLAVCLLVACLVAVSTHARRRALLGGGISKSGFLQPKTFETCLGSLERTVEHKHWCIVVGLLLQAG
jgi:hypothetical protein